MCGEGGLDSRTLIEHGGVANEPPSVELWPGGGDKTSTVINNISLPTEDYLFCKFKTRKEKWNNEALSIVPPRLSYLRSLE